MSFFGMGAWEIGIILIAALVIFGPDRLPEMAGKVGKQIRDLRQMSTDLTGEFERSAGVQEFKTAIQGEISGVKSQVNSVSSSVKRDLDKAGSKVSSTAKAATTSSTSKVSTAKTTTSLTTKTTAAKSSTTAAKKEPPKASKKDPLADLAFFEEATATTPVKPAANTISAKPAAATTVKPTTSLSTNGTSATSEDQIDALTRARQRRQAAGYNRRPS